MYIDKASNMVSPRNLRTVLVHLNHIFDVSEKLLQYSRVCLCPSFCLSIHTLHVREY